MKRSQISLAISLTFLAATLVGCTSSGLTSSGGRLSSAKYNTEIDRQGLDHYCANDTCDSPPKLLRGGAPIYPPKALASGIAGEATVSFVVGLDGAVSRIEVVSSSAPEFGKAAIIAVEKWQFEPARLKGEPVQLQLTQQFPFRP